MKLSRYAPIVIVSLAMVGCVDNNKNSASGGSGGDPGGGAGTGPLTGCAALNTLDLGASGMEIIDLDASNLSPIVTDVFDRYTAITTPSGDRVHFVAQSGVSDAKIRRAREIMRMHLADLPGAGAGASKGDVADAVSGNCGTIAMFANESEYDLADPAVSTFDADFGGAYVPLFGNRVIVEGSAAYLKSNPGYDQTFGATSVLIYRQGMLAKRPGWVSQLALAATNAEADGTFNPVNEKPYLNLNEAYLGVVMESHSGVWGHDPSGDGSAQNGVYAFGDRPAMVAGDESTVALMEDFFRPEHTFAAEIDMDFSGTFDLLYRETVPHTNRSQYLSNVRLTGDNASELFGTGHNDTRIGNDGNNNLRGRSGDDTLDGGEGLDTAVFSGNRSEFTITNNGDGSTTVQHNQVPGLGTDTCRRISILSFSDQNVNI